MPAQSSSLSPRQTDLLKALWSEGAFIPVISARLSADLQPGERRIGIEGVTLWRRRLGLAPRWVRNPLGAVGNRGVEVNVPPMGKLPDPAEVERIWGGHRFEDAVVPAPRGRLGSAGPTRSAQASSAALFEGMAS